MKRFITTAILLCLISMQACLLAQPSGSKSAFNLFYNPQTGESTKIFDKSTALIIANYEYKNGWGNLKDVKKEYRPLADSLFRLGFDTIIRLNLTKDQMETTIKWFINNYGYNRKARILIYYSGHGNVTMERGKERGYTVPVNAPLFIPNADFDKLEDYTRYERDNRIDYKLVEEYKKKQDDFEQKAISYDQWLAWAKDLRTKHALFLFDCCFAGQILYAEKSYQLSVEIEKAVTNEAVEFITASDRYQTAPGKSTFLEYFLLAISGKDHGADANGDGYLKSSELFDYLSVNVHRKAGDNPRRGGLPQDIDKQGEFVFVLPGAGQKLPPSKPGNQSVIITETYLTGSIELKTEISGTLYLNGVQKQYVNKGARYTLNNVPVGTDSLRIEGNEPWEEILTVNEGLTTHTTARRRFVNYTETAAGLNLGMVAVEGGQFEMGCTSEQGSDCTTWENPPHPVTVRNFYIGKYEVTNTQFCKFLNEKGNQTEGGLEWINLSGKYEDEKCRIYKSGSNFYVESGYDNYPVIYVNWYGAKAFCEWIRTKTGKNYQLPTEAQWEFAARSRGKAVKYAWGNGTPTRSNGGNIADEAGKRKYSSWTIWEGYDDGYIYTAPVGSFGTNELGLADMSGNVWEWCQDDWHSNYNGAPTNGSAWIDSPRGSNRVLRGGSWCNSPRYCRVANRYSNTPGYRDDNRGFRLALAP